MQTKLDTLKNEFKNINIQLNSSTNAFVESDNKNKDVAVSVYNVSFDEDGINIQDFDNLLVDFESKNEDKDKCFDVLVISENNTKYIELKNSINRNLQDIGNKFHFGGYKANIVLDIIDRESNDIKYVVIYTNDNFLNINIKDINEPSLKKTLIGLQEDIHEWKNNRVFVHSITDSELESNIIDIIKILYVENDTIELDNIK